MKYLFIKTATTNMYSNISLTDEELKKYGYKDIKELKLISQIAYILCDDLFNIIDKSMDYVLPDIMPNAFTMEHNSITPQMLKNAEPFEKTKTGKKILSILKEEDITVIGHNINFDIEMLEAVHIDLSKNNLIDTLQLSKRYIREDNNRLNYLFYATKLYEKSLRIINDNKLFQLSPNGRRLKDLSIMLKNSMFSCLATYQLLNYIMEINKYKIEDLIEIANSKIILKEMPYGKHKGMKIATIDDAYILYLYKNKIEDQNLKLTFELEIKKRGGLEKILNSMNIYQLERMSEPNDSSNKKFLNIAQKVFNEQKEKQLIFSYGKHNGEHISKVLENDPSYITFMKDNHKLNKYMINYLK